MSTWTVMTNDEIPLATIQSHPEGRISVVIHATGFITTRKAEEIRWALGAAIGDARAIMSGSGDDGTDRGSRGGVNRV